MEKNYKKIYSEALCLLEAGFIKESLKLLKIVSKGYNLYVDLSKKHISNIYYKKLNKPLKALKYLEKDSYDYYFIKSSIYLERNKHQKFKRIIFDITENFGSNDRFEHLINLSKFLILKKDFSSARLILKMVSDINLNIEVDNLFNYINLCTLLNNKNYKKAKKVLEKIDIKDNLFLIKKDYKIKKFFKENKK